MAVSILINQYFHALFRIALQLKVGLRGHLRATNPEFDAQKP